MKCPKCHAPMESVLHHGQIVHRCGGCRGLWFGENQLTLLASKKHRHMLDIGDETLGQAFNDCHDSSCPSCQTVHLQRLPVSGQEYLMVDECPQCQGHFLDAGEFLQYQRPGVFGQLRAAYARLVA